MLVLTNTNGAVVKLRTVDLLIQSQERFFITIVNLFSLGTIISLSMLQEVTSLCLWLVQNGPLDLF